MEKVIGYTLGALVVFGALMLEAYVVMEGWGWFVVPLGVPSISTWEAFGICAFTGLLFGAPLDVFKDHKLSLEKVMLALVARPAFALFLMYFAYRMAQ